MEWRTNGRLLSRDPKRPTIDSSSHAASFLAAGPVPASALERRTPIKARSWERREIRRLGLLANEASELP